MAETARMPRTVWFWIAMAYLVATVSYNILTQWFSIIHPYEFSSYLGLVGNLSLKIIGIGLLLCRRTQGVFFLMAAFALGLFGTILQFYQDGSWAFLSTNSKIGTINGFLISFVIILYLWKLRARAIVDANRLIDVFS